MNGGSKDALLAGIKRAPDAGALPPDDAERPARARLEALLTVAEVAVLLAVSKRTVRRLVTRGRLPCVRVGSQVRFSPAILARWAERGGR